MPWETPNFIEVKMDAEVGSYQEDPEKPRGGEAKAQKVGEKRSEE